MADVNIEVSQFTATSHAAQIVTHAQVFTLVTSFQSQRVNIEVKQFVVSPQVSRIVSVAQQGVPGPPGPIGPAGEDGDKHYEHRQDVPASVWTIPHGLGKKPTIDIEDSGGNDVEGEYSYPDNNTVIATFSAAFSGKAYCN